MYAVTVTDRPLILALPQPLDVIESSLGNLTAYTLVMAIVFILHFLFLSFLTCDCGCASACGCGVAVGGSIVYVLQKADNTDVVFERSSLPVTTVSVEGCPDVRVLTFRESLYLTRSLLMISC